MITELLFHLNEVRRPLSGPSPIPARPDRPVRVDRSSHHPGDPT